jgi:hypothetical protein
VAGVAAAALATGAGSATDAGAFATGSCDDGSGPLGGLGEDGGSSGGRGNGTFTFRFGGSFTRTPPGAIVTSMPFPRSAGNDTATWTVGNGGAIFGSETGTVAAAGRAPRKHDPATANAQAVRMIDVPGATPPSLPNSTENPHLGKLGQSNGRSCGLWLLAALADLSGSS